MAEVSDEAVGSRCLDAVVLRLRSVLPLGPLGETLHLADGNGFRVGAERPPLRFLYPADTSESQSTAVLPSADATSE